jgi:pseudaminic acid cytidylyltransferase
MAICVIPARGGSKRIPRKNIRLFAGKPMLAWSIQAAQQAGCFDHILVSTDDPEIARLAQQLGAAVPFMRPANLADDYAGTTDVVVHAIEYLNHAGYPSSAVCCLYATAPFVQPQDLCQGLAFLSNLPDDRFVFSATSYPYPIQRAIHLDSQGRARMCSPDCFHKRSQDLQEAYHDAGQFYWGSPQSWCSLSNLFEGSLPLLLPRWRVQDIDTEEDWVRAELMFNAISGGQQDG